MRLQSKLLEMTYDEAVEHFYREGLTDGLPVVIPTEERVVAMLEYAQRDPQELLGVMPPREGLATVEKVAIQAVMAGCLPTYFPVVLAAVEALLDDRFNLNGVQCTANCEYPLVIVNGPIRRELGMATGGNFFSPGVRANAAIGRAVRLVLWNIGGGIPPADKATQGQPSKYSYCVAENEEENPWEPLHVERGLSPDESAVTVIGCEAPHAVMATGGAEATLIPYADTLSALGNNNILVGGKVAMVLNPEHAAAIAAEGWSKADVKQFIFERARRKMRDVKRHGFYPETTVRNTRAWLPVGDDDADVPVLDRPEDLLVIVGGGHSIPFGALMPSWGPFGGWPVTRPVRIPGRA